jgi:hypothetical protein
VLRNVEAAPDGERHGTLRGPDLDGLNKNLDSCSRVRAENGAMSNRLEAADSRPAADRGDRDTLFRHRGRRHRQDDDRFQLPVRRYQAR